MNVDPAPIKGNVLLAPMSGITDAPFRAAALELGAPAVVCEMITSRELVLGRPESLRRAVDHGTDRNGAPLIIQLAGRDPALMADGARIAADLGADVIDINMGCPAKKVTGGLAGAALMREPRRALAVIEAVVGAVSVPVTVKMRLGWDDDDRNAPSLARAAENAGISLITVHGRTRCQFYRGKADWRAIARVKQAVGVPVVANGDIDSIEAATRVLTVTGADAVMVGRGAQGRPWLPGQIAAFLSTGIRRPDPTQEEELEIVSAQYERSLTHYGRELGTRCVRKHLGWHLDRHAGRVADIGKWRRRILTSEEPVQVLRLLASFFSLLEEGTAA